MLGHRMKLIEIRTYKIKPGHSEQFVFAFQRALPLVLESGMDVVATGRSSHEHESYYLIRSYNDRAQLEEQQNDFYSSDAWRKGPREPLIE
nr:putative integron gene cassette protein [uncultured bacterium]